jgi:hypothetical protein
LCQKTEACIFMIFLIINRMIFTVEIERSSMSE